MIQIGDFLFTKVFICKENGISLYMCATVRLCMRVYVFIEYASVILRIDVGRETVNRWKITWASHVWEFVRIANIVTKSVICMCARVPY